MGPLEEIVKMAICLYWIKPYLLKYLVLNLKATFTSAISTGTSTNGPITAAKASPELMPNSATAKAMSSLKL
jgi:hypothetical protein